MKKRIIKVATCIVMLGATSSMLMAAKAGDVYGKCIASGPNKCEGQAVGGNISIWCSPEANKTCNNR